MCKEDVRIKRKTAQATARIAVTTNVIARALLARPDRVSVTICINENGSGAYTYGATLGFMSGADFVGIISLSTARPSATLTIEQVGILLTNELWYSSGAAFGGITLCITEVYFLEELETL